MPGLGHLSHPTGIQQVLGTVSRVSKRPLQCAPGYFPPSSSSSFPARLPATMAKHFKSLIQSNFLPAMNSQWARMEGVLCKRLGNL